MSGFSKKKRPNSRKDKPNSGAPIISVLLLEGNSFPVDLFLRKAARTKMARKAVKKTDRGDGCVSSFEVGDEFVTLALMPAPYPATELEGPLATTWLWPPKQPIEQVKRHRSHLLISVSGGSGDPVRRRLILTAVTALAARQAGVMAVYWPEATLVISPRVFVKLAKTMASPAEPPLYLWVDLRVFQNEDGTMGLFTTGLPPLGHMEIEIPSIDMEPGDLREWLLYVMYYLLDKGPVLKPGETIGTTYRTVDLTFRIQHGASKYGHSGKVIRLVP